MSKVISCLMAALLIAATSLAADISQVTPATGHSFEVGQVRWLEDGSFQTSTVKMPKKRLDDYLGKLESCKTADEGFAVLQEFGLIPEGKTLFDLEAAMEAKVLEDFPDYKTIDELRSAVRAWRFETSHVNELCDERLCWASGHIESPFLSIFATAVFYYWISDHGGSVEMNCVTGNCSCSGDNYNDGLIIGWVGFFVPRMTRPFTAWDVNYFGFAIIISVICD